MSKILTISIAAYNVEKYIRETLDSLCVDEVIDDLEVFVVDDGGKDRTFEIANEYAAKYPHSIFPIHKENGGWGSTVNYSIEHATGKYFRLLDGDDYFDKDGLRKLIEKLKNVDSDVVYTSYRRFDDTSHKTVERFDAGEKTPLNALIQIGQAQDTDFVMHASTFRTSLLQINQVRVLEHCFYTDNEYRTKAMAFVKNAYVTNILVYQYRVGREGQSVDISGLKKHYKDNLSVFRELAVFLTNLPLEANRSLTIKNVQSVVVYHYNTLILLNMKDEIQSFDTEVKKTNKELYRVAFSLLQQDVY